MPTFFGLSDNYRPMLHQEIFSLIYHGKGGFTWQDVYSMPVWLRKFYIKLANEEVRRHNEQIEESKSSKTSPMQRKPFTGLKRK